MGQGEGTGGGVEHVGLENMFVGKTLGFVFQISVKTKASDYESR